MNVSFYIIDKRGLTQTWNVGSPTHSIFRHCMQSAEQFHIKDCETTKNTIYFVLRTLAMSTASEQVQLLDKRSNSTCRCTYKIRRFYSKGAFLVLFWVTLVSIANCSITLNLLHRLRRIFEMSWIATVPTALMVVPVVLSGWLADTKYGNYKVLRFGLILLFLGTLNISICSFFLDYLLGINRYLADAILGVAIGPFAIGWICFTVTSLQLGLDQMPDASSYSITSFIAWFVFCLYAGEWISYILNNIQWNCAINNFSISNNIQIWILHAVLCTSVALISDLILTKRWLIMEPNSTHSLKTIYQVLKFAAKHKAPLNRSALTYWEEDIPSRMDLGKSRYGGPFSTEQVEDVKTILRLLMMSLSVWVVAFSLFINPYIYLVSETDSSLAICSKYFIASFTYRNNWCVVIGTLIYEFGIYPIIRNRIPTILQRIGITSFLITILSAVLLILEFVQYSYINTEILQWSTSAIHWMSKGLLTWSLLCAAFELVVSQAPYNMRGLFVSFMTIIVFSSLFLGEVTGRQLSEVCSSCKMILFGLKVGISLFGFILYCLLAYWYKKRVRDDVFSPHTVVEEVYDRYLTARAEHTTLTATASYNQC